MKNPVSISVALIAAVALGLLALEVRHHWKYGHFFPLGMHADMGDFKAGIGPGATTFLEAHLTNFGLYPQEIERRESLSGTNAHEGRIANRLEQLDDTTHGWKTLFNSPQNFCRPYPLGTSQSKVIKKLLWTGQTLSTGVDEVPYRTTRQ